VNDANNSWYYGRAGKSVGPFAWPEICDLARAGLIRSDAAVWNETTGNRVRAAEIPGLLQALSVVPDPEMKPEPDLSRVPKSIPVARVKNPGIEAAPAPVILAWTTEADTAPPPESTPPAASADPDMQRLQLVGALAITAPILFLVLHHWAFYAGAGWQPDEVIFNLVGVGILFGIPLGHGVGWLVRRVSRIPFRDRCIHPTMWVYGTVALGVLWGIGLVYFSHRSLVEDRRSFQGSLAWATHCEQEGKWTNAVMAYDSALKIGRTAEVFFRRAYVHRRLGQLDLALNDLNTAIVLRSDFASAYSMRAEVHEARGDKVLAKQDRDLADNLNKFR
jgi:hypothetical protein